MKKIKRIISVFLCMAFMMPMVQVQAAKESKDYWPKQSEEIEAGAAILMDVDTGTILYKKNINETYYPASITKILTTLIAIENSTMDEIVTFSEDSVYKTEGSGIWRDIGEKMTMEQCLYAVMLESANECAYAVAEHIGGTMQKFVKMMNAKAKALGCKNSHFNNPHGLPDEKHYVTAKDMAIIARAAYENETFRLLCGTKRYTIPKTNKHNEVTPMVNHHKMLYPKDTDAYLYDYCTGGKTGYTVAAGHTLVTYAQKDGMTLLAVILNGSSPKYWNETRTLFEFGFENFNMCNVAEYAEINDSDTEEKYDSLNTNEPYAQIDPQSRIILPKTVNFSKTTMEISYENLPENVLAQLKYTYGKRKIGTADIIRTNAVIDESGIVVNEADTADAEDGLLNTAEQTQNAEASTNADNKDNKENKDSKDDSNAAKPDKDNNSENAGSGGLENEKSEKFDIKSLFSNTVEKVKNINFENLFSLKFLLIVIGIVGAVLLIFIFKSFYNNSYIVRQKIANYRNRKRARKQYTIIRDTRRKRGRRKRW